MKENLVWPGLMDSPDRKLKTSWGSDLWLKDNSNTDISIHAGKAVSTFYQCGDAYAPWIRCNFRNSR